MKKIYYIFKKRKIGGAALDVIDGEWLSKIKLKIIPNKISKEKQ